MSDVYAAVHLLYAYYTGALTRLDADLLSSHEFDVLAEVFEIRGTELMTESWHGTNPIVDCPLDPKPLGL